MTRFLGPNHYSYYSVLQRRLIWLRMVAKHQTILPELATTIENSYRSTFLRLPQAHHLGITKQLDLDRYIDDTPVDSFLANIGESLDAIESYLFSTLTQNPAHGPLLLAELTETARLWGRNLGQEVIVSESFTNLTENSLVGVFEVSSAILEGGESCLKPFLLRRYTNNELQFESSFCPHRKPYVLSTAARDLACQLESEILSGFLECIAPGVEYRRHTNQHYCLNHVSI